VVPAEQGDGIAHAQLVHGPRMIMLGSYGADGESDRLIPKCDAMRTGSSDHTCATRHPVAPRPPVGEAPGVMATGAKGIKGRKPRPGVEERIAELSALRDDPTAPGAEALITRGLAGKRGAVAAAAARVIAEGELEGFEEALAPAFDTFMEQPLKRDPGCLAKTAIARALYRVGRAGRSGEAVFLRGVRHVQLEPVWGGRQDTAVELRGQCALGLVRCGYPDAMTELAELLADAEPMARVGAAQAIAYSERQDVGVPLLRHRARAGDPDARVTSACFAGLLSLAPEGSLPFVAGFVHEGDAETAEAAMIALGESRSAGALPLLAEVAAESPTSERRAVAYLAIALMRTDAAWDHLLNVLRDESEARAHDALDALATYRTEPTVRARVMDALQERADPRLLAAAREAFDQEGSASA
jgi:HEAT repeat protein